MKSKIITSLLLLCASYSIIGQGIVSTNGLLKVNGNQIENKNGTPYSVAGNSIFWSGFETVGGKFYKAEVVDYLAQNWDSQVVRAAIAVEEADGVNIDNYNISFPGGLVPNSNGSGLYNNYEFELAKAKVIIDAAIENDIYVIVDFHTHFAHHFEALAIQFFEEIATEYGNNEHIIYEIFNEPINTNDYRIKDDQNIFNENEFNLTWNNIIRPYAINVINAIRAIDPDNLIVVGTPGFSQGVGTASQTPITTSDLDLGFGAELNLAYTLHFYAGQSDHNALIDDQAQVALNNGIALFVTEWGTVAANGDGDVNQDQTLVWMDFLKANNISHANWAITDKFEGAAAISGNASIDGLLNDDLTNSGDFVKCIIEGWNTNAYGTCEAEIEEETEDVDSELVPNGLGIKFEVEKPTELDPNTNSRIDYLSPGLSIGDFDGEGIVTGFKPGESAVINANGFLASDSYTVQIVASSSVAGNFVLLLDDVFAYLGGDITTSTSLDNYEIIVISGVQFNEGFQNIRIAIGDDNFSGSMNIESVYVIPDSEFDENALSIPTFDAELANSIKLYPNPVVDYITIDTNEDVAYRIFDLNGSELVAKTEYTQSVDVSALSKGIYFIQLYVKNQTQVYKFIK